MIGTIRSTHLLRAWQQAGRSQASKSVVAATCYAVVLLAAWFGCDSTSGWFLTGVGVVLLLDRCLFRMARWPSLLWRQELGVTAVSFVLGAVVFASIRPGSVPLNEAIYRGANLVFVVTLLRALVHWLCDPWAGQKGRLAVWGLLVLAMALVSPVLLTLHPLRTVPKRVPIVSDLPVEEVQFPAADGVHLAGWLVQSPESRGTVIFCHGHGRNRGQVAAMLPTVCDLRLNVLAFDFRGHGQSDGHTTTFGPREVQDLLGAVAYVQQRVGRGPIVLFGISMGAAVILQALPQLSEVRGVWIEGAFDRFSNVLDNFFHWVPQGLRGPQLRLYEWLGWLDCGFWASTVNPIEGVSATKVPIYFCHGQNDELVPWSEGQRLYQQDNGPKICWWVEGANHYNIRQKHFEEYQRRLSGFLEQCLAR